MNYDTKRTNPYDCIPAQILDAMTDADYEDFLEAYKAWHRRHWPSSCMRLPRRKSKNERAKEDAEYKKRLLEDPSWNEFERNQAIKNFEKEYPEYKVVKREN